MSNNMSIPKTIPMLVDKRETARLTGLSVGTIEKLWRSGELPSVKILTRRLFVVADIRAFIEAKKTGVK